MNKIVSLSIKNFRQIEALEIDFKGSSTYYSIAGRNRMGKTSILEAIDLAFNQTTARYTKISECDFFNEEDIEIKVTLNDPFFLCLPPDKTGDTKERLIPCYSFSKIIKCRSSKELNQIFSSEFDVKWNFFPCKFAKGNQPFKIDEVEKKLKSDKLIGKEQYIVKSFNYDESSTNVTINYENSSKTYEGIQIFGFQYLQRIIFPEIFFFDSNREKEIIPGYNTLISKIIEELEWRYRKKLNSEVSSIIEDSQKVFDQIRSLDKRESEIFTGVSKLLDENFDNIIRGEHLGFYPYNWNSPYSNSIWGLISGNQKIIPANKIGSGISNLLALVLSISFARISKNPAILLIDEPELHLESFLKKKVFEFFKKIPEMVIVSTHSPQFIDKEEMVNNIIIEEDSNAKKISYGNSLLISDLIFRLYGESVGDLIIPEKVLIVEGKYDKQLIIKCLELLGYQNKGIQVIPAGSKDRIPNTPEQYEDVIKEILSQGKWYAKYINKVMKIIVDEDVIDAKVDSWVSTYGFNKSEQILRVGNESEDKKQNCFEYIYPQSLVMNLVKDTDPILRDDSKLKDKDFPSIISIILTDDKKADTNKEQKDRRISKQRLNEYVVNNINKEVLELEEGKNLKSVIEWITCEK